MNLPLLWTLSGQGRSFNDEDSWIFVYNLILCCWTCTCKFRLKWPLKESKNAHSQNCPRKLCFYKTIKYPGWLFYNRLGEIKEDWYILFHTLSLKGVGDLFAGVDFKREKEELFCNIIALYHAPLELKKWKE